MKKLGRETGNQVGVAVRLGYSSHSIQQSSVASYVVIEFYVLY